MKDFHIVLDFRNMGVQKKNAGISNESQHDAGNDGPKKDMVTRITQGAIAGEVQVPQKPVSRDGGIRNHPRGKACPYGMIIQVY